MTQFAYTFRSHDRDVVVVAEHLDEAIEKASPLCPGGMEFIGRELIVRAPNTP